MRPTTRKGMLTVLVACGLAMTPLTARLQTAAPPQNAQELYQRGLVQEQAAGNLNEAIELYQRAVKEAGKDRTLAARALIRAAGSQEKLGLPEAAQSYAEVIRAYPEQREQASLAQTRLAALRQTPAPTSQNVVRNSARTDVSAVVGPFFKEYCISCHNQTRRVGYLALDDAPQIRERTTGDLSVDLNTRNVGVNSTVWENLLRRLRARRDPPAGLPRPGEGAYQAVISKLELALDQAYPASVSLNTAERATDVELAARIATFIWGGSPDAELLNVAQRGRLRDPAVLDQQVRRMLQDPRSINLATSFLFERWGFFNYLDRVKPDPARFPDLDQSLLQSMGTETKLFLDSQLREDHSALELWTANYTFLNERLARHYGIPNISGNEFRRVTLRDNTRAGILGQASLMTITWVSPTRTSPTKRGIYIWDQFFGIDSPNPPPNVPPLGDTQDDRARSMRERVAAHKTNPACVNCHVIFDPLGFGLENFDAIGQWRNTDGGGPIDASGAFVDGARFNGPAELRAGLLKYRDAYYSSITERLLRYALGRKDGGSRVYDYEMPSVRAIVRGAAPSDYRWSSIISGIVKSTPFQMKSIVP